MPNFSQQRLMPYSRNQVFDMVADVKSYPEFLPWCFAARVKHHHKELFEANLVVGFQLLRENFTSFVVLNRSEYSICVEHTKGPFKHLINRWNFNEDEMGCKVEFYLDFEFRSIFLKKLMGSLFEDAARRMVESFEERARFLYKDNNNYCK